MSNKKELVENNLEELSKKIGLLIKQYNLLAESENITDRLLLVEADPGNIGPINESHIPQDIYDVVVKYNDSQGWSSSQSC